MAPEYNLNIQARIPMALCAIHNFICQHDPTEGNLPEQENLIFNSEDPAYRTSLEDAKEDEGGGNVRQDEIAWGMWDDYQQIIAERGAQGAMDYFSDDEVDNNNSFSVHLENE